LFIVY